jgi:hypothetical protein
LCVTDQKNPCLYLIYSKLGLPSDNPTEQICWTERFYIKTDLKDRKLNDVRPYEAVYDKATLELNAQLNRKIEQKSSHFAEIFFGEENVTQDIARAQASPDWKVFTLNFDEGDFVPIYQQPYHGAVNVKTGRFNFYVYHPEPILRGKLKEKFVHLADMTVNVYADLLGITTVRRNAFEKFSTSKITDSSLWKSDANTDKHNNVVAAIVLMRWVEINHHYRFRLDQLSQRLVYYAEKEGLTLDDDADDSPVLQINRHMSRKAGNIAANKVLPNGTPYLASIGAKGRESQAVHSFPQLLALHAAERPMGWPTLNRGRETQRAGDWAGLRQTVVNRINKYQDELMAAIEATNKRKQEEDPSFVPPPVKRPTAPKYTHTKTTTKCTLCKAKLTEGGVAQHIGSAHGIWGEDRPFKCALATCDKHFKTEKDAEIHHSNCHSPKVKCPDCSKEYGPHTLNRHRRD